MNEQHKEDLARRLDEVKTSIRQTADRVNRNPDEIDLIVVTKEKSAVVVKTLAELGVKQIGESYLKEAAFKIDLLQEYDLEWHMIGTLQTGKTAQAARLFDQVHSVDRVKLARSLAKAAAEAGKRLPIYLECNVSGEETKHGWHAQDDSRWTELAEQLEDVFRLKTLNVMGLMTMAPYSDDPEDARPYFQKLRRLSEFLQKIYPDQLGRGLSMGMSGDYTAAIEEGATVLRIGSRIVGSRR